MGIWESSLVKKYHMYEKNLLVIGGSGFIGRWVVKEGLNRGYKVTVLSLKSLHNKSKISNVEYLKVDLSKRSIVKKYLSNKFYTHVINLGGYIDHSSFLEGGRETLDIHFGGLLNLIECLDWTLLESFIQIGSSDEYGDASAPQSEDSIIRPISSYSLAKSAASYFLQMLHRTENFPVVILRFFLVYGPGQDNSRFIPQVILGCLKNSTFDASQGKQLRDFCFITDVVEAIYLSLESSEVNGEIINIASGDAVTIRSVIQKINTIIGKGQPKYGEILYRKGENMKLYANINKAKKILDWQPKITLEDGLKETINYYNVESQ